MFCNAFKYDRLINFILGPLVMFSGGWNKTILEPEGRWLLIKLIFVVLLYLYFFSLHRIYKQQVNNIFKYSTQQLRIWNEVATIFLVAIVMLAEVKKIVRPETTIVKFSHVSVFIKIISLC